MPLTVRTPVRDEFPWQSQVLDKDLTAPPGGESEGDRYIVGSPATGVWSGYENYIAEYTGSGWDFFPPGQGWYAYLLDEAETYQYVGSAWHLGTGNPRTVDFQYFSSIGPFVSCTATSYETLGRWEFAGSTRMGVPIKISGIIWRNSGANPVDIRVYDRDNLTTIAEYTGLTSEDIAAVDLGTISNVPNDPAIWEIQMKTGVGTTGRMSSLQIQW